MFLVKAKLDLVKSLETKSKIIFSTKDELNEIQIAQAMKCDGYLAFSADQLKKEVEEAMRNSKIGVTEEGFTMSQVFRGVCFRIANDQGLEPEDFYRNEMKKIIKHYKAKYL